MSSRAGRFQVKKAKSKQCTTLCFDSSQCHTLFQTCSVSMVIKNNRNYTVGPLKMLLSILGNLTATTSDTNNCPLAFQIIYFALTKPCTLSLLAAERRGIIIHAGHVRLRDMRFCNSPILAMGLNLVSIHFFICDMGVATCTSHYPMCRCAVRINKHNVCDVQSSKCHIQGLIARPPAIAIAWCMKGCTSLMRPSVS